MPVIYEAVVELVEEDGSYELPELPPNYSAYLRDVWTNKRIEVKTRGRTKLPEGRIRWSQSEELVEWFDVDPSRYTLFIVSPCDEHEDDKQEQGTQDE